MISEKKDTKLDLFWKCVIGLVLFGMIEGFISIEIVYLVLFFSSIVIAIYIPIAACIFISENYKRKLVPWLRIRKLKKEFTRPNSPFYGWKYELLAPALYFPWDEVVRDKPMQQKNWIPEPQFHLDDSVYNSANLFDEDHEAFPLGEFYVGCQHENFVTLYHRGKRKFRTLEYKEEGLLHVCLKCQKQIGYDWVGLN